MWLLTIAWHQAINRRRGLTRLWRLVTLPKPDEDADAVFSTVAAASPTPEQAAVSTSTAAAC